jgi:Holliday junction resolvasome RuvABC ATP-dependent DNA helicase subunit
MKSKPLVMDHFSTVHTSFVVDFRFTNNITILTGDSGTGKTASFSFIQECMAMNTDILCLNYLDYQKDIAGIIKTAEKKLIVIDNADVLLCDEIRKYIALDDKNQYLIIGRNPKNLLVTKEKGGQTILKLKNYLEPTKWFAQRRA